MNDAMLSFIEIINYVTPYVVSWGLGIKAFRFVVGCFLGKDVSI